MAVCKFWRQGYCKNGESCRFEHPPNLNTSNQNQNQNRNQNPNQNQNRFGGIQNQNSNQTRFVSGLPDAPNTFGRPRSGNQPGRGAPGRAEPPLPREARNYRLDIRALEEDLGRERPLWPMSCYGPGQDCPTQLFGGFPLEHSMEEMRVMHYINLVAGNPQQSAQQEQELATQANTQVQNALNDLTGAIKYICDGVNTHPNRLDIVTQSMPNPPNGEFSIQRQRQRQRDQNTTNNNNNNNPRPGPTGFGSQPQPQTNVGPNGFGQPAQPIAALNQNIISPANGMGGGGFGQPQGFVQTAFGQQPQQGNLGGFGQPSMTSDSGNSGFPQRNSDTSMSPKQETFARNDTAFGQNNGSGQLESTTNIGTSKGFGQTAGLANHALGNTFSAQNMPISNGFGMPTQSSQSNGFGAPSQQNQQNGFGKALEPTQAPSFADAQRTSQPQALPNTTTTTLTSSAPPGDITSYATRNMNNNLVGWKGHPVKVIDGNPCYQSPHDGSWERIWFPEGPPPAPKANEVPADAEYSSTVKDAYTYLSQKGEFEGEIMPEMAPKGEWVRWDL